MKKIAVVILNWNGVKLLEQFLPSVVENSHEAAIYVADNASTDNSVEFVKTNFPSVKIIQNEGNYGFAKGYNEALRYVEEDYFALVNSDIEVTAGWLTPILPIFEADENTAIIQPKIRDFKNKDYFEYAGAAGGFIDKFGYPFCRGRVFETLEKDHGQFNDSADIFWASGACFFIRREVFRKLNGFDIDFFAHQEEIDLCWRAFNLGYKTRYTPLSLVYHVGGATLNESNPRKTFLNFRNSLLMLTKNLPEKELYRIIFVRLILDGIAGVHFLLNGKFIHIWAIIKAHYSFYTQINKTLKKRYDFQKEKYFHCTSLIHLYFIKKRKHYNDLLK